MTEAVRGEGGVLRNKDGHRFMFDDIPENYRSSTADNPEEGWRYTQGDKSARRPPELLTRDHVARCINREVKAGRGSPHGGVFLDIAWIKEKLSNSADHIKRKLPSMYHQFKQLADLDITTTPMEIGPTTHYTMGGIKVEGDTQMSTLPGLFAAGEAAAGLHGANRLGGNSLSDLIVFGKRAGEYAAEFAKKQGAGRIDDGQVERATKQALAPFERGANGENPYAVQDDLQGMMQNLVGIVRQESEMKEALEKLKSLWARTERAGIGGGDDGERGLELLERLRVVPCIEGDPPGDVSRDRARGVFVLGQLRFRAREIQIVADQGDARQDFVRVGTRSSGPFAASVHVRTACAPRAWPKSIEVCASTPVNAGSCRATIRSGLPRTIEANDTA